jgi:arylsulfatase A-like enzyme
MHGNTVDIIELPLAEVTIAEELKSAGYRTNLVGKWHMGYSTWSKTPTFRGFDSFYGFYGGQIDYWTKMDGPNLDFHDGLAVASDAYTLSPSTHSAYLYQQRAEAVIADHALNYADQPMFMYYASQLIHDAWQAPTRFLTRCYDSTATSDQTAYCAMNLMLDEVVGNLTCALERSGMLDNTLFVLVSDNGGLPSMTGNSYPFKGAKGSVYRGGVSANGFVYGSSNIIPTARRGTKYSGLMHVTDWLPTLMSAATNGAWTGSYSGAKLDGVNQMGGLLGLTATSPRREILHYLDASGLIAYQYDSTKVIVNLSKQGSFGAVQHYFTDKSNGVQFEACDFMAELSVTTNAPSVKSTTIPTALPVATSTPSVRLATPPTKLPTLSPSALPTAIAPRSLPPTTAVPSADPSKVPNYAPSRLPTTSPTVVPSLFSPPLTSLSLSPSTIPSTAAANQVPTIKPRALPTFQPSPLPSAAGQSASPSVTVSTSPTKKPKASSSKWHLTTDF